jgi:starch synthase
MHILLATPEIAPFSQQGPLAQWSAALPRALRDQKAISAAAVITPLYGYMDPDALQLARRLRTLQVKIERRVEEVVLYEGATPDRVRVFFLQHPLFDEGPLYHKRHNAARFSFFSRAVVEFCRTSPAPTDIIHCMGWATALVPLYLDLLGDERLEDTLTVFAPCDLRQQGDFVPRDFDALGLPKALYSPEALERSGRLHFMQAGLLFGDVILADSPSAARDLQTEALGHGLDDLFSEREEDLFGVLPGVALEGWDPSRDAAISLTYDAEHLNGKRRNKSELQHIFGLPVRPMIPLLGFLGELSARRGGALVVGALEVLLDRGEDLQCALLCPDGEEALLAAAVALQEKHPRNVGLHFGELEEALTHRAVAGIDGKLTARERVDLLLDRRLLRRDRCAGHPPLPPTSAWHDQEDPGRRRGHRLRHTSTAAWSTSSPRTSRSSAAASRGPTPEDLQDHGPRHEERRAGHRPQRLRRRAHPGGRGLARWLRRHLPAQHAGLRRRPPDLGDHGPCAGRRGLLPAITDFILMVEGTSYMFVTGPGRHQDRHPRRGDEGGPRRRRDPRRQERRVPLHLGNDAACLMGIRELLSFLPSNNIDDPPGRPGATTTRPRVGPAGQARAGRPEQALRHPSD